MTLAAISLVAVTLFGQVLDRIVVIIDNGFIITLSDIRKERAIESAFGENPGNDDAVTNDLIEQHLINNQLAQFRNIEVSDEAVTEQLQTLTGQPAGVSRAELRQAVVERLRREEFLIQRFRQFIRVSDDELRTYYNDVYAPELRRRGLPVPSPEEGMEQVRPNVILEKMNQEVDAWIADLRRRSTIEKILQ